MIAAPSLSSFLPLLRLFSSFYYLLIAADAHSSFSSSLSVIFFLLSLDCCLRTRTRKATTRRRTFLLSLDCCLPLLQAFAQRGEGAPFYYLLIAAMTSYFCRLLPAILQITFYYLLIAAPCQCARTAQQPSTFYYLLIAANKRKVRLLLQVLRQALSTIS